jgi:hypothetical protein
MVPPIITYYDELNLLSYDDIWSRAYFPFIYEISFLVVTDKIKTISNFWTSACCKSCGSGSALVWKLDPDPQPRMQPCVKH